jgi:hypothetical protein
MNWSHGRALRRCAWDSTLTDAVRYSRAGLLFRSSCGAQRGRHAPRRAPSVAHHACERSRRPRTPRSPPPRARLETLVDRQIEQAPEEALARDADPTGRPSAASSRSRAISSRLWRDVLPKPVPGSSAHVASSRCPGVRAARSLPPSHFRGLPGDIVVARGLLHLSEGVPRMCMSTSPAPLRATTSPCAGRRAPTRRSRRVRRRRAPFCGPRRSPCRPTSTRPRSEARRFQHRAEPPPSLVRRYRARPGGALGTEIHQSAPSSRSCGRLAATRQYVSAAVRERVGRHVDDSHARDAIVHSKDPIATAPTAWDYFATARRASRSPRICAAWVWACAA